MKMLCLMRHAEAENNTDDFTRALTSLGQEQRIRAATFMVENDIFPDLIMSSDALRARDTAAAIKGKNLEQDPELYLADARVVMMKIFDAPDAARSLMVVAHNPGIADLSHYLDETSPHFSPATIAIFECDIDEWVDLGPETTRLVKVFSF